MGLSNGWIVVAIYEDVGASGTSINGRIEFQRMIAEAQAGKFDAILVLNRPLRSIPP